MFSNKCRIILLRTLFTEVERVHALPIRRRNDYLTGFGDKVTLSSTMPSFEVKEDFWRVITYFADGTTHQHLHTCVVEKPEVLERPLGSNKQDTLLNIMVIIFDGTSNAHFQRMLPESYAFLKDEMNSTIFKGSSIVGDATTPNLAALLTGRSVGENLKMFGEGRRGYPDSGPIDSWPFIFKDLKKRGFATLYSEDQTQLGKIGVLSFIRVIKYMHSQRWREATLKNCVWGRGKGEGGKRARLIEPPMAVREHAPSKKFSNIVRNASKFCIR